MARVLVITGDVVPVDGRAASGAGLRAWGIGEGLRSQGHDVSYAMPTSYSEGRRERRRNVVFFDPATLDAFLDEHDPDVAVFQHWPLVSVLRHEHRARLVIDFHGPLLLETLFRDKDDVRRLVDVKLHALARADYFTCASTRQLYYYASYLLLAGIDLHELPISVVPFSMPPELPEHRDWPAPPVFVYGGVFLPWQDPHVGLRVLVEELERAAAGHLRLFGGRHPWMALGSEERWDDLKRSLETSARVTFVPTLPRTELIGEYAAASVAWDVMARNLERELAFTSRTVEYLWCGLPVVYNDYAELAEYVRDADAGWTVDPLDEDAIRATVREILSDADTVRRKGENARRLVRSRLAWDRTIAPLDAFCREPRAPLRLADRPLVGAGNGDPPDLSALNPFLISEEMAVVLARARSAIPAPARRVLKRVLRAVAARSR